jgi:hypothetical protein
VQSGDEEDAAAPPALEAKEANADPVTDGGPQAITSDGTNELLATLLQQALQKKEKLVRNIVRKRRRESGSYPPGRE